MYTFLLSSLLIPSKKLYVPGAAQSDGAHGPILRIWLPAPLMLKSAPETEKVPPPGPVDAVPEIIVAACAENTETASPARASIAPERKPLWMVFMLIMVSSWGASGKPLKTLGSLLSNLPSVSTPL